MEINKKVLFITNSNILMDNRIKKNMDALKQQSIFNVFGFGVEDFKNSHQSWNYELNLQNLEIKSKNYKVPRFIKRALMLVEMNFTFYRIYRKHKPEIIHINDHHLLISVILYRQFKKNLCIVYDAHEIGSQLASISKLESTVISKLERAIWSYLYAFISPSSLANNWYLNRYGNKKNIVLRNIPVIGSDYKTIETLNKKKENHISFVYVGSLVEGRGIEMLIRLFSQDDVKSSLSFIGYGKLESFIIEQTKLNSRIFYYKAVPFDELISYLKSFEFDYGFALIENTCLNEYYCSPNKLFEYATAGIKVVATNLPEMASLIAKHNLGYVVDFDYESIYELVKAIERKDIVSKNEMKLDGLNWEVEKNKLQNLYMELIQ